MIIKIKMIKREGMLLCLLIFCLVFTFLGINVSKQK